MWRRRRREPDVVTTRSRAVRFADPELPCHGCAHSASGAPFPGHPSGERPCGFCVRNPELGDGEVAEWFGERGPRWYGGELEPFKTPMDCYIATDRLQEERRFIEAAKQDARSR